MDLDHAHALAPPLDPEEPPNVGRLQQLHPERHEPELRVAPARLEVAEEARHNLGRHQGAHALLQPQERHADRAAAAQRRPPLQPGLMAASIWMTGSCTDVVRP